MKKTRHRHINFDEEDSALSDSLSNKTNKHSYRKTRLVDTKQTNAETHEGIVIAGVGALWLVNVMLNDYDKSVTTIECKAAGIIISEHQDASLIAVGDKVGIELQNNETSYTGTIVRVAQRYTRLSRVIAAKHKTEQVVVSNIDQLIIVMAAAEPFFNVRLIDRYLIAADKGDLEPIICINKVDLMPLDFIKEQLSVYTTLGIQIVLTSVKQKVGLSELDEILCNKSSVLSGPSGVGKSSLTNALLGENAQNTRNVSETSSKGMHTTSFVKMFALKNDGYLVDTPGLREFAIWDLSLDELPFYFTEFENFRHNCKFNTCTHIHEPDCAVIEAVHEGLIHPERYQSYCNIRESLLQ
ncbi:MAG: ribosome small subunit-dependent GTPase A [Ignavibacteria bacterium]|jgi:ribosome biogenesis GTPase|nr:ribosome small subunit-dependent GTPase A [Ignavibacteria bacterium]